MAKARSLEKQKRNEIIYAEWLRGASLTDLGNRHGLARQVVTRIVKDQYPEGAEEDDRALFRGYMWRLYDEVQEIGDSPGFKMRPDGRPAEDLEGNPALDTNVQVQAKELQLKILRELRLLDGRDRQQQRQTMAQDAAAAAARASIEALAEAKAARDREIEERHRRELEEVARRAAVIPGTAEAVPVRELPPAGP